MALRTLLRLPSTKMVFNTVGECHINILRHGHHLRGLSPEAARSIVERLQELHIKDPELTRRIDIGLPLMKSRIDKQTEVEILKLVRKNDKMEQQSRKQTLKIDLEKTYEEWVIGIGPKQIKMIADHYKIYEHLFLDAYFHPLISMNISFETMNFQHPVYFGNILTPNYARKKPIVEYSYHEDKLWTLILTNLDGHFTDNSKEYVHWMIGNIPGSAIEKGETVVKYLQPFPPKGTGYHRFVFTLYMQEDKINYSKLFQSNINEFDLEARTFSTLEFYRDKQDYLTPVGLNFFQTHWDATLTNFYHEKLQMKEPIFEYDFDPPYIRPQKWFPLRQPFNLYMDKYRDPKQINKEFLQRKLKNVHPFREPSPPIPFPNAEPWSKQYIPSWLKLEITKSRLKWGRINDIE